MSKIRIALSAVNQTPINWKENIANITKALSEGKQKNAELIVLPELALTGYGCQDLFFSDWLYEKAEKHIEALISQNPDSTFTIGVPVKIEGQNFNGVLVVQKSKILGITFKQHLANDGLHYEHRWFTPWKKNEVKTITYANQTINVGDLVYDINGTKIGIEICRDAWKGEQRTAHNLIEKGAQIIIHPSASHFAFGKTMVREELGLSLTKKYNNCFLLVNLLGNESGRAIYDGDIQFHQNGKLKYKAERLSLKLVDTHIIDVDTENAENSTEYLPTDWFFKNEEFTLAATVGLFDYIRKVKSKGFILSLSGGADSALCAILVAHMVRRLLRHYSVTEISHLFDFKAPAEEKNWPLFKKREFVMQNLLVCVYQSAKNSSDGTYEAARHLAKSIGCEFFHWSVDDEITSFINKTEFVLGRKLSWDTDDLALQNIQARMRAPGIWMLANITGKLLLTTSNRSEASVGYATMDGDSAGSLAPIAGVDKHFVRRYLLWAEEELGYEGLSKINNQTPTAELRPNDKNQSDEDDLMPYFILNKIEQKAIGEWKSPTQVFEELIEEIPFPHGKIKTYVAKFFRLWSLNQWKRERYAPSFHFDNYNVDPKTWCRFPIISGNFKDEINEMMKD